jgi:hypothetical protein
LERLKYSSSYYDGEDNRTAKALEAVAKWLFKPGMRNGEPVTVRATFEVNFRLL